MRRRADRHANTSAASIPLALAEASGRGLIERGDLVVATGRAERFRDELQIDLRSIRRAEAADPAEFLPIAYRDLDELVSLTSC